MNTVENWSPQQLHDALAAGGVALIDIREPGEHRMARIEGSRLVPMTRFDLSALPDPARQRIVLYCASGARSLHVANQLVAAGHTPMAHLHGGIQAWANAGLPVARG